MVAQNTRLDSGMNRAMCVVMYVIMAEAVGGLLAADIIAVV
jgi:hypothetical protein